MKKWEDLTVEERFEKEIEILKAKVASYERHLKEIRSKNDDQGLLFDERSVPAFTSQEND